jgi:hypothetical protein
MIEKHQVVLRVVLWQQTLSATIPYWKSGTTRGKDEAFKPSTAVA